MSIWAVLMAAGSGTRMGHDGNKVLSGIQGKPMLAHCAQAFRGEVDGIAVVTRAADLVAVHALNVADIIVLGGDTRQASVLCGLRALPEDAEIVLVHDAARPFVRAEIIRRCVKAAMEYGSGVAAVPVKDTIQCADVQGEYIVDTPARETLWMAQTPQAFRVQALRDALSALEAQGIVLTDDAGAMRHMGHSVRLVMGDYGNIKMTTPEDWRLAAGMMNMNTAYRVGQGYDVHRLAAGRKLVLCGVEIPWEKGLLGHSDADVALHALMDALLGAAAMGDIGRHFPDTDLRYAGASSAGLLREVMQMLKQSGFTVENADITIVAQQPKLAPWMDAMRASVCEMLGICSHDVNVKATTTEKLGFEGEGKGMSAHAVVMLRYMKE